MTTLVPGTKVPFSKTSLKMTGTLWFHKSGKYKNQMQTLSKKLKELNVGGSDYVRTFKWQG